jgi:hypothetical protein
MLRRTISLTKQILFYGVIVCILIGCPTVHYQGTQGDFNRGDYQKVAGELTDTQVQSLDPKLQFNAYTLRAYSEWQTGKLAEAKQTAAIAMAQPGLVAGPRDKFLMSILPTLVDEQEMYNKYKQLPEPKQITMQTYKNYYENGYMGVVSTLKKAYTQAPADVPGSSLDYAHCQRGRVLGNWRTIMNHIWDGVKPKSIATLNLEAEAQDRAKQFLQGTSVADEINKERKFPCPESKELLAAKATQ